jgi:hypothetical protein
LSVPGPEPLLHLPRADAPGPRRAPSGGGRARLGARTLLVAVQVACVSLVGWLGATLTLLPLALRGGPAGRRVLAARASVIRLQVTAPPREALPR